MFRISRIGLAGIVTLSLSAGLALGTFTAAPIRVQGQDEIDAQTTLLQRLYREINPSVVALEVTIPRGSSSLDLLPEDPNSEGQNAPNALAAGSGFFFDNAGHIVTNAHVVRDANSIIVKFADNSEATATVVGFDEDSDIAVLKTETPEGVDTLPPALNIGDSDKVEVGERAIAFGNPFNYNGTMTEGIISALGRSLTGRQSGTSFYSIPQVLQTDAAINPGNSGGPLVNSRGEVIGVNTAIESRVRQSSGVGFAVPSNIVKRVADAIIESGKVEYSYLGISIRPLNAGVNKEIGLPAQTRGVLVEQITSGGPADGPLRAGRRTVTVNEVEFNIGGDIITAVEGTPIRTTDELLNFLVVKTRPGQEVTMTVLRDGEETQVNVTLGVRP